MSELAEQDRVVKRGWAAPGGVHDFLIKAMKLLLPAGVGVLLAYLLLSPLSRKTEDSFRLDKKEVAVAPERMKILAAQYRGTDNQGRPFVIDTASAIQPTSDQPVVDINGMAARIVLELIRSRDTDVVRDARLSHDVAVLIRRERLHRRGTNVDPHRDG